MAEALEGLEALDSKLVRLEQAPDDPALLGEIFRLAHTLKGTSGFLGLSRLQGVAHAAENVLGGFRDGTLAVTPGAVSAILDVLDVIREIVDHLSVQGEEPGGDDSRLIAALDAIFAGTGAEAAPEAKAAARPLLEQLGGEATLDAACEAALFTLTTDADVQAVAGTLDADRLQSALRDGLCAIARGGAGNFPIALAAALPGLGTGAADRVLAAIRKALLELEAEAEAVDLVLAPPTPAPAVAPKPEPASSATPACAAAPSADGGQSIRVNVEVLENLMTVVSELVLIRNQLIQTLRTDPESAFAGPLNRLNQVTSELQEGVMTTRMQPISGAWAKLPRLVRDLAADLGKSIELVMQGQETELDRQVLELIKDPLTHMIRNAADHGIETPERRRAAGKPGTGRILLQARHEGGAILVEMSDDGRGLPAEAIRAKALSASLITPAQAAAMTDAEARQLIFAPGFSTADQVTAVSGRGVGMDVVRTNIEKIGGAIELASVEGQGTRFTIRIPLTLSIVSALIVEASGERFAMPQSSIIELVSTGAGPLSDDIENAPEGEGDNGGGQPARRIEEINGAWVLRLRDRLLPLVSLQALLGLEEREDPRADACIVVARIGAFTFGVIVDRVFDTEEIVVKPVASVLRHLKIYSGATIMGDGSVIMILDFKGMSLEAGAGHLVNGAEDAPEAGTEASGETRTLLVFRTPEAALKAAPLDSVARIEDLDCASIEHVDGRSVIQYRGALMPVVGCDGRPVLIEDGTDEGRRRPLLVFARGATGFGVLADEIVDIVEGPAMAQLGGAGASAAGSLIVAGQATELIDLDFYGRGAGVTPAPDAVAARTGDRRILVVDQSPFTRLLLGPLLAQAGYGVEVAASARDALTLHDGGAVYDLILADTTPGAPGARQLAQTLGQASAWHATPLLGLGAYRMEARDRMDSLEADLANGLDRDRLLTDLDDNLIRGAA
ncbi:hybrid sensor histidine kinase/response regulator [Brevundimonas goettingensis]|uniref:hybrid sensor histidine kinase/response regulator n=1 Tax=Brevundimonas goettingensis TaxID=2774190 RepID=UPI001A9DF4EE|nr:hybrid sensor histidine kinase/response regulator [Brevundimonas goettingensis]